MHVMYPESWVQDRSSQPFSQQQAGSPYWAHPAKKRPLSPHTAFYQSGLVQPDHTIYKIDEMKFIKLNKGGIESPPNRRPKVYQDRTKRRSIVSAFPSGSRA
ncbi:hypothetical protein RR46_09437 [Papilio xuthus]|uniref:Uncharacterized protein n=1 Tax=Papilio xuthus TaxID=66420 RepID=A0A194PY04_PAPXU|nr:hypothetical protein RR46_09437 [Papilio xuthus]